jgi:hypothetical protein
MCEWVRACVRAYVCPRVYACALACVGICVRGCVRCCVLACVRVCKYEYECTCVCALFLILSLLRLCWNLATRQTAKRRFNKTSNAPAPYYNMCAWTEHRSSSNNICAVPLFGYSQPYRQRLIYVQCSRNIL